MPLCCSFRSLHVSCFIFTAARVNVPTSIRYGGMAIAYNVAVAFFGGITPWFSAYLMTATGNPFSPAYYVMGAALITFLTVLRAKETAGQPLRR